MRFFVLTVVLVAFAGLADEPQVELFSDKGDLFIRAGAKSGLKVGSTVTVLGDKIGNTSERRRTGTATVLEVWDTVSRVNLDDAAKNEKAPRLVALDSGAKAAAKAGATVVPPPPPAAHGAIKAHATINGLGPLKRITLTNDNSYDWHSCELRLPDNRRFTLGALSASDRNSISLPNFNQDGVVLDVPIDSMLVKCAEGETRVHFAM